MDNHLGAEHALTKLDFTFNVQADEHGDDARRGFGNRFDGHADRSSALTATHDSGAPAPHREAFQICAQRPHRQYLFSSGCRAVVVITKATGIGDRRPGS